MASKEEKKRKKETQKVLNSPALKNLRDSINDNSKATTNALFGSDQGFIDRNAADFDQIRGTIKRVTEKYKQVTGEGIIEFMTKMVIDDERTTQKAKKDQMQSQGNLDLNQVLENPNNGIVNELFLKEKTRFNLYDDYEALFEYIPQLAQAVEVFVDNIMSPDDFTKDIFSIFYDNKNVSDMSSEQRVIANIKNLEETYKIENKAKDWVRKTLIKGDQFIAILPLEKEFNRIIGEDGILFNEHTDTVLFNEDSVVLSEHDEELLNGYLSESADKSKVNWKEDLMKIMNENITYSENRYSVIKEELLMESDFSSLNVRDEFKPTRLTDLAATKKQNKSVKELLTSDSLLLNDRETKNENVVINGSFIKELDPRRVVKIKMGETCFGYYYIETNDDRMSYTTNSFNSTTSFQLKMASDMRNDTEQIADPKTRLIVDVFAKNISKKLNKKFIEANKEFKNVIYELVKQDYIIKKRVNIVYLPPNEVEHLMIHENEDGYGTSRFKKILFTSKLYLAVLTTTLMMKISRSVDHRTFYIETGLSKDVEGIIQSFVREIKSKEVKLSDLKSIDSIFNNIGQFHDYFIPQVNGEKAIDIDTTPGMNTEVENDFLDYLKKTMISGMGIPASFLTYSDEMEFARSVSMMNGMFLRTIVGMQKSLGESFSNIYRKLYKYEFEAENQKDMDEDFIVDYKKIETRFPSPASLNMTNLADQISSTQGIIDFIVTNLAGSSAEDSVRDRLTRGVTKKYFPNIEWESFEKMMDETNVEEIENKLTPKVATDDSAV